MTRGTTRGTTRGATPGATPGALNWSLRIGWGIGSLGAATLINAVTFVALFYMTGTLGISPALAGVLLFSTKCYDIVTDPVMGIISDRCRTRWGRRRPWLLAAALLSPAALVMLFNVPALPADRLTWYVTGALLLYATGYTVFNIPYLAMPAEMTTDYHERSRLMSARVVFASLGILAGGSLAPALLSVFGGVADNAAVAYSRMSYVLAGIVGISMAACFFGTHSAARTNHVSTGMTAREQWRTAVGNRPFVVLLAAKFLHMAGVATVTSSLLYVVTIVLERDTSAAGIFGVAATVGTVLSMPAWLAASKRVGKRNAYIAGVALYVPVLLSWLLAGPEEPLGALIARGLCFGIVTGGLILTAQAMLPDTITYDTQRIGLRREGTFTSIYSLMEKTAFAIGPLIVGLLLESSGYDPHAASGGSPATVRAILIGAAIIPAAASGLSAWVLRYYTLDETLRFDRGRPE